MSKRKYKKYKNLYLPKEIVNSVVLAHSLRNDDTIRLDICFDMIHNIILKSRFNKVENEYIDLFAPMSSDYLKKRYGNQYKVHKDFLFQTNLIYIDDSYPTKASYFYVQNISIYMNLIESHLRDINIEKKDLHISSLSYCLKNNIEIVNQNTINTDKLVNQKNRIYGKWYKVKIEIDSKNKSYFVNDYKADSIFINNAPKHIKAMGSHYRKSFKLDSEKALKYTEEQYFDETEKARNDKEKNRAYNRYITRISSIKQIENGRINKSLKFNRNSTNKRLDTNLTMMASDLRQFIVGWDEMSYLDLKNAQPVLFNNILKDYYEGASEALKKEIDEYRRYTFKGKWYERLKLIFKEDRDTCKDIWMEIAYSQNKSYRNHKNLFKKEFPEINSIIENIKSTNHKDFAITLQKIESKVFIDMICRELFTNGIIPFTIHDGLIVKKSEQNKTLEIMEQILTDYLGDTPKISIE